ncbi:penicillin-binding protein 2 [Candidatus Endomicrobiellum agilis]|uniref:penicillin-binding protein 2 n=1 Tax=Candidatus Endomicrobiellum agilis TaxID=3238957 RepID=UPI003575F4EE|nr:penicillin-binding protein 2 [Endomicrobium sp.]
MTLQKEDKSAYEAFLKKHKIILMFFILLFICLSLRLFYLQIIKGGSYEKVSQQQRMHSTYERAPRGVIYSADNIVLADNEFTYAALFYPFGRQQTPTNESIKELNKILGRDVKISADKCYRYGRFVKLADNITMEEMFKIQEKKSILKNISIVRETRRIYCYPEVVSHVIGYTGEISVDEIEKWSEQERKIGDYVGRGGIEQSYDVYLQGKDGGWQVEVNAKGYRVKAFKYVPPQAGSNVYSTVDLKLQKAAYDALKSSSTGRGAVVVLDTRTGAVKALVSCPGFDANKAGAKDFGRYLKDKNLPLFNRSLQAVYPPGSVFKIITFAAAVELLNIDSEKTVRCTGSFELGNRHYSCWYKPGHGAVNLISALARSCNVYFYQLGLKLGIGNLEKYARKFYFGQKTDIDLPNEKKGFVPSPEWKKSKLKMPWLYGDTVIFAIGQGALLVTPIQMAYAMSAVANRGVCRKPYIVDRIVDFNGNEVYKHALEFGGRIDLSDKTWSLLCKALLETVESGAGIRSKISGVKIAGKTGTAQNPHGSDHAWFVSYAPADAPEIAIAVVVENGGGGGLNAVPISRKIYETYFNIESEKEERQ